MLLACVFAVLASIATTNVSASSDSVIIVTPEFVSMDNSSNTTHDFGNNAAYMLNLQLWRKLKIPRDRNGEITSSKGLMLWTGSNTKITSHIGAEEAVRQNLAQMMFWGSVFPYGNGAIIQPYLSIPRYHDFREDNNEIWSITFENITIQVDMPRRRYDFAPIQIETNVLERFSTPFTLELCDTRNTNTICKLVKLNNGFRALEHHQDCSLIATLRTADKLGWMCGGLPSRNVSEAINFVSGIARIIRADWHGAVESFNGVLNQKQAPLRLKMDARLFMAMSLHKGILNGTIDIADEAFEHLGSSTQLLQEALAINTASKTVFKYLVMSLLSDAKAAIEEGKQPDIDEIKRQLVRHRILLSPNDPWLQSLNEIVRFLDDTYQSSDEHQQGPSTSR